MTKHVPPKATVTAVNEVWGQEEGQEMSNRGNT